MHISKNQIKAVRSLQQKKERDEQHLFVAEGYKLISDLCQTFDCKMLISTAEQAQLHGLSNYIEATAKEIEQMSSMRTPQGIIAVFEQPQKIDITTHIEQLKDQLILVLDDIQDPGNLGTIIRTADWFSVKNIICSLHTADCFNPKVVQATMGALSRVSIYYTDLQPFLLSYKELGNPIYGTILKGENMYEKALSTSAAIIMGNEGNGISAEIIEHITEPILIPSYPQDAVTSESLNVSIATGITLAHFRYIQSIKESAAPIDSRLIS